MGVSEAVKKRDIEQKKRVAANKKKLLAALEREPKIEVMVKNLDFLNQGVPIQFNYQGVKKYDLPDGTKQRLPIRVVEHINSITVPESVYDDPDPVTGQRKHRIFMRQRFSAIPTNINTLFERPSDKGEETDEKGKDQ